MTSSKMGVPFLLIMRVLSEMMGEAGEVAVGLGKGFRAFLRTTFPPCVLGRHLDSCGRAWGCSWWSRGRAGSEGGEEGGLIQVCYSDCECWNGLRRSWVVVEDCWRWGVSGSSLQVPDPGCEYSNQLLLPIKEGIQCAVGVGEGL